MLLSIAEAGHEIGNHSFGHETGFHTQPEDDIRSELARTDTAIEYVTGYRPVGFRGPSYGISKGVLNALAARDYLYDATTFPTLIGPLARLYYRVRAAGEDPVGGEAAPMLGESGFAALRSLRPYRWQLAAGNSLMEIPITTMPLLRLPIHATYLQWLGSFSPRLAIAYFCTALGLCRLRAVAPSLILHPTDFIGCDDITSLGHLPAMNVPGARKRKLMIEMVNILAERFVILPLRSYAEGLARETTLRVRRADF